jgi:hypothetical protein
MRLKSSICGQYQAGLAMLRQAVERCPDAVWASGVYPRTYSRIAYHAVFFTHLYLQPNEESFRRWSGDRGYDPNLWGDAEPVEPYSQSEILEYIDFVNSIVVSAVDKLDLESDESGFSWYPRVTKLDHQLMNFRHLQGHVGQLSEILMSHGLDTDWMALWREPSA